MAKASLVIPQWVVVADWNQFGAVADTWAGSPVVCEVDRSDLLWDLTQGVRWTPTENMRSDPILFEFIERVLSEDGVEVAAARAQFPLRSGPCRYSLAISHSTRMRVNREENLREKPPEAIKYRAPPTRGDNAPQSMWLWPGQELIGAGGQCKKGIFFAVSAVTPKKLTVVGNGETMTLSAEKAVKSLRLTHCLTYASCQGLSLAGVRLLQTDSPYFTWKHLYVGASRCTSSTTLQVG